MLKYHALHCRIFFFWYTLPKLFVAACLGLFQIFLKRLNTCIYFLTIKLIWKLKAKCKISCSVHRVLADECGEDRLLRGCVSVLFLCKTKWLEAIWGGKGPFALQATYNPSSREVRVETEAGPWWQKLKQTMEEGYLMACSPCSFNLLSSTTFLPGGGTVDPLSSMTK